MELPENGTDEMDGRDPNHHVPEIQDFPFVVAVAGDLPTHLHEDTQVHTSTLSGGIGWEGIPLPFVTGIERERRRGREERAGCDRDVEGSWASGGGGAP